MALTAITILFLCFLISYFNVLYLVRFSTFVKYSVKSGTGAIATNAGLSQECV